MKRVGIILATVVCVFGLVTFAHAQESSSIADLQAQIDALEEQVESLQEQLVSITENTEEESEDTDEEDEETEEDEEESDSEDDADEEEDEAEDNESGPPEFAKNMFRGMQGQGVKRLQQVLATDDQVYPQGLTTGYFGPMTEEALRAFQEKYGLSQTGIVDSKTRSVINEILQEGAGNSGNIPPGLLKKFGDGSVLDNLPSAAEVRCKAAGNVPSVAASPFADCPEDDEQDEDDTDEGEEDGEAEDDEEESDSEDDAGEDDTSTSTDST